MSAVAELDREASSSSSSGSAASPSDTAPSAPKVQPSEDQLLDVLYEMLVQGLPPKSTLTREQIERFLHEHARSRKSPEEMLAFFEQHELPMRAEDYGADPELGELALGLQQERSSLVPGFGFAEPEEPATLPPATVEAIRREVAPVLPDVESTGRHTVQKVVALPEPDNKRWLLYAAAALVLLALGAGVALSQRRASELEQRLDQAHLQQRSTDLALTKLEQRAESLQGALRQSDQDRREEVTRVQNELDQQAKQRATEEAAVEKVLGPRYTKLRQKLATEVVPPGQPTLSKP